MATKENDPKRNGSEPVRLDRDVIEYLKKQALPFETKGAVVRRLLGLAPKRKVSEK